MVLDLIYEFRFFRVEERTKVIVSRGFAYTHWRFLAMFLVVCTWLKIVGLQSVQLFKVTPSQPCFPALCLIHCCLRTSLHRFLHLHLVRLPLSLVHPSVSPSTATLQARLCFGRWAEQSPLTLALAGCESGNSTDSFVPMWFWKAHQETAPQVACSGVKYGGDCAAFESLERRMVLFLGPKNHLL